MPWKSSPPIWLVSMLPQWSPALVFVRSTWSSLAVYHPSTIKAQCCLTTVFEWELVFPTWQIRCRLVRLFNQYFTAYYYYLSFSSRGLYHNNSRIRNCGCISVSKHIFWKKLAYCNYGRKVLWYRPHLCLNNSASSPSNSYHSDVFSSHYLNDWNCRSLVLETEIS